MSHEALPTARTAYARHDGCAGQDCSMTFNVTGAQQRLDAFRTAAIEYT